MNRHKTAQYYFKRQRQSTYEISYKIWYRNVKKLGFIQIKICIENIFSQPNHSKEAIFLFQNGGKESHNDNIFLERTLDSHE